MAERDGTIVIDTQIDTKGVDAGSEKTEASLRRMAQKVNDIGATAKAAVIMVRYRQGNQSQAATLCYGGIKNTLQTKERRAIRWLHILI